MIGGNGAGKTTLLSLIGGRKVSHQFFLPFTGAVVQRVSKCSLVRSYKIKHVSIFSFLIQMFHPATAIEVFGRPAFNDTSLSNDVAFMGDWWRTGNIVKLYNEI